METIKLKAPEGSTGVSVEGIEYNVSDGIVEVPYSAVEQLVGAHGFTVHSEQTVSEPAKPVEPVAPTEETKQEAPKAPDEAAGAGPEVTEVNTVAAAQTAEPVKTEESAPVAAEAPALPWAKKAK